MPELCRAFGLIVQTEVPIPGALPIEVSAERVPQADVIIEHGPALLSVEHERSGPYRTGPEGLLFERSGVARFLCDRRGRSMRVEATPGAAQEDIAAYLVATALPALLWTRGALLLHGAAAVLPGEKQAVVLAGRSGSGKSTVLQAIVEVGGEVVAEDSVCLRARGGALEGSGLPGCLHLRAPGAPLDANRRMQAVPSRQCRASERLAAVVVLEPGDEVSGFEFTRLTGPDGLALLLRHRHRPRVPWLLGQSASLLPAWAAVAQSLPVYSWKFRGAAPLVDDGKDWHALAAGLQAELRRTGL